MVYSYSVRFIVVVYAIMTLYFLQRYEDLQSKIKYQNKATYLHNIHEVVHERDQQVYG